MRAARYDSIAGAYSARPDDYSGPATGALFELVGDLEGRQVLDLACGSGLMARGLARCGAEVLGLDLSGSLLAEALAREVAEPLGVRYVHADITAPDVLSEAGPFDVISCHFGLTDIDDLAAALRNVARLLSPRGLFAFVILHPCFPGVERVSGSWPPRRTYFDEGWWLADGELSWIRAAVGSNHRKASTYLNALVDAGLTIETILEPAPDEEWARERPGTSALPLYLAVSARVTGAGGRPGGP